ncbi:uncharacterized protein LOC144862873 [Branchiostoma floridae x Branchiostoma japonicum]
MASEEDQSRVAEVQTAEVAVPLTGSEVQPKSIKKPSGWNAFYNSVAPDVMTELGEGARLAEVPKVVGNMWRKLPADRRKDWKDQAQRSRELMDMGLLEKKRCPNCNTPFSRDNDLKYHVKRCHDCACQDCNETFSHEQKLKRHMAKYHTERFKCSHCDKTFPQKRNLVRHQQKLHNIN